MAGQPQDPQADCIDAREDDLPVGPAHKITKARFFPRSKQASGFKPNSATPVADSAGNSIVVADGVRPIVLRQSQPLDVLNAQSHGTSPGEVVVVLP